MLLCGIFEALTSLEEPEIEEISLWKKKEEKEKAQSKTSPLEKEKLPFSSIYFEIVRFPILRFFCFLCLAQEEPVCLKWEGQIRCNNN